MTDMQRLSTLVGLASEARNMRYLYSSNSYAREALRLANKTKQKSLAGKLILLCRKNHEAIRAGKCAVL